MKTNKFLVFALLLGSFALNAETTYYKRDGNSWTEVKKEEYDNSFKSTGPRSEVVSTSDITIDGEVKRCRSTGRGEYIQCSTAFQTKSNIGGNPATWGPVNDKPLLGRDPRTWTPSNLTSPAPEVNPNIGGDKNTWAPINEPTYQDSTGLLGRSTNTYAPKGVIIG